jgi:hypothetical protein
LYVSNTGTPSSLAISCDFTAAASKFLRVTGRSASSEVLAVLEAFVNSSFRLCVSVNLASAVPVAHESCLSLYAPMSPTLTWFLSACLKGTPSGWWSHITIQFGSRSFSTMSRTVRTLSKWSSGSSVSSSAAAFQPRKYCPYLLSEQNSSSVVLRFSWNQGAGWRE